MHFRDTWRRFALGFESGYDHAAMGVGLLETVRHLRRPLPLQVTTDLFGKPLLVGCIACPSVKRLREVFEPRPSWRELVIRIHEERRRVDREAR